MAASVKLILLYISFKIVEYSPLYFLSGAGKTLIWETIEKRFANKTSAEQAAAIKFLTGYPTWLYWFLLIFILGTPILIGLITKNKKTVSNYWKFSLLVDAGVVAYTLFAPCNSGLMIASCGLARLAYFILFFILAGVRFISSLLAKKLVRE